MTTVAMIGLGRMGGPMADCVAHAGHDLRVFDVSADAVAARVAHGAVAAASPADAARDADVVGIVVFDDAQVLEVALGPDGVLAALRPGAVLAVHTTVTLDTIRALAAEASARDIDVLDAGISGGEPGAQAGTLLTMVGGEAAAVARATPVMQAFSKEVLHAGALGAGMALKLARNATGYALMAAVHEAMVLATRAGVDLTMLRHTIEETGVLPQALAPFVLGGPEPLGPDEHERRVAMEHLARLADKDLDHALALGREVDATLEVFETTMRTFRAVSRLTTP